MRLFKQGLVIGVLLACQAIPAAAYNPAGHYFTVDLIVREASSLNGDDARLVAFCTQLPDMSSDLDATVMFKDYLFSPSPSIAWDRTHWLFTNVGVPPASLDGRQMATIQHLVHALTGGTASAMQTTAGEVLDKLAINANGAPSEDHDAALCALGFGFHLYGDSFAHHMMNDHHGHSFTTMYATGFGHFNDGHYPDYPLCSQFALGNHLRQHCLSDYGERTAAWRVYLGLAAGHITAAPPRTTVSAALSASVAQAVTVSEIHADDWDDWNDDQFSAELMQKVLHDFPAAAGYDSKMPDFIDQHHSQMPCEAVLKDAFAGGGPLQGIPKFACWQIWKQYYPTARAIFLDAANQAARASGHGYDGAYCEPFVNDTQYCSTLDFSGAPEELAHLPEQ